MAADTARPFPHKGLPATCRKTAERNGVIAVLIMVGYVVRVRHDEHVIVRIVRPASVEADDDLPVSGPVHPIHQDRDSAVKDRKVGFMLRVIIINVIITIVIGIKGEP